MWTVVLTFVLQPFANVITTVVDPPRLFLVGVLLSGVWTIGDISYVGPIWIEDGGLDPHTPAGEVVLGVLAAIALAMTVAGIVGNVRATKQWGLVIAGIKGLPVRNSALRTTPLERATTLRTAARVRAILMLVGGTLVMLIALGLNFFGYLPWPSTVVGVVAGGVLALASSTRHTSVPGASGYVGRDRAMVSLASALLVVILAYPALIASGVFPELTQFAADVAVVWPVGIAAFFISIACNAGWQGGWLIRERLGASIWATTWWIVEALFAGATAWWVMFGLTQPRVGVHSHAVDAIFVIVALFAAGTVQWYLVRVGRVDPPDIPRRK